jgi:hypothetical protein
MMRLMCLPLVNQIAWARDVLVAKLSDVDQGKFSITIGGRDSEDDETKRQLKPVLQRILRERIGSLDRDLESFDVDVLT